ncbi:hypothetical protein [Roseibium hamelinense]|nr:hypothetical protein [Roseibium hamelinense]
MQGYLLGHPMPIDGLCRKLKPDIRQILSGQDGLGSDGAWPPAVSEASSA